MVSFAGFSLVDVRCGMRSQTGMRAVLDKLGVLVIPEAFALSNAHQPFDAEGVLKDESVGRLTSDVGAALYRTASRLA
ncbi:MAG TPA: hypothetical protein VF534_33320 [Paraburkholderia sp.]